jgi:hypothetical protein
VRVRRHQRPGLLLRQRHGRDQPRRRSPVRGRGVSGVSGPTYFLGVELGQVAAYTALAVVERRVPTREARETVRAGAARTTRTESLPAAYDCRHFERLRLGTTYPAVVARVRALLGTPELTRRTTLAVGATDVGRPVVDMLRQQGLAVVAVTITGGDNVTQEGWAWRVPKRDLVGAVQVLLQAERLKFAAVHPARLVSQPREQRHGRQPRLPRVFEPGESALDHRVLVEVERLAVGEEAECGGQLRRLVGLRQAREILGDARDHGVSPPTGPGCQRVARVPGAEVGDRGLERGVVFGGEGHAGKIRGGGASGAVRPSALPVSGRAGAGGDGHACRAVGVALRSHPRAAA